MQDQLDKSKAEIDAITKMKERVEKILEGIAETHIVDPIATGDEVSEEKTFDPTKEVWEELEKEFG